MDEINELWRLLGSTLMISFLELFRKYIEHHEKSLDAFEKRKPGTLRSYNAKYNLINDFLFENSFVKIKAVDFDIKKSKALSDWLVSKNYNHNYIVRVRHICKTVLQFGAENEYIKTNPLSFLKLKKVAPKPPPFLNAEQIQMIIDYAPKTYRGYCFY